MASNKDRETIGSTFGRLTALSAVESQTKPPGRRRYLCRCSCGSEVTVDGSSLRNGNTKSCGCLISEGIIERSTKHGFARSCGELPEYSAWSMTRQRCENPNQRDYKYYGGRGIRVCERWKNFSNFIDDMGPRPPGYTLERVNNDLDYGPENCVWAPRRAQTKNRRITNLLTCWGQTKTFSEWSDITGIAYSTIKARVKRLGYPPEIALTKPVKEGQRPCYEH